MESSEPHDVTICPFCQSEMRRVPGVWLGHGGFECVRCGKFIDFSRELTAADESGEVDDRGEPLTKSDDVQRRIRRTRRNIG